MYHEYALSSDSQKRNAARSFFLVSLIKEMFVVKYYD